MEYTTLKVPELRKLLQERSLPVTGNKADLVSRLQEDDKTKAPASAADQPAEDEIDYSDDEVTITTKAAEPKSAPTQPETAQTESAPATEDAQVADAAKDQPTATDVAEGEAAPADGAQEEAEAAASEKFALNLAPSSADEEARKRAERAKRFGVVEDDEAAKKAERAKKFGIDNSDLAKSLDSALPERPLKRGRGGQNEENGGRKRQDQRQDRQNNRRGQGRRGGRSGGARGGGGVVKTGGSIPQDAAEKAKAEARAKRFGTN